MGNKVKFNLIIIFILLNTCNLYAQHFIHVIDKSTKEDLPYANICIEEIKSGEKTFCTSDEDGIAVNNVTQKSIIAISFIGYETLIDTLLPGKSIKFHLNPKIFELDEMVVTAQFSPERADKSIYKMKVISSKDIIDKGATNLSDLLATEVNFRTSQDAALGSKISLQGLTGEHVKILIDGIPVIGRMDGNIDLSQLDLNNVDHVEIIEGPMSVIYGSNALAGAINIITKENKIAKLHSSVKSYYESVGVYNLGGNIALNKKKSIFSLNLSRNFFNGYTEFDDPRYREWKPKRQYNLGGYYIYDNDKLKLKLSTNFLNELILDKGRLIAPYYETAFDHYFYTNRSISKIEISKKLKKENYINFIGSYSFYDRKKNTYFKDLTTLEETLTSNPDDNDTTEFSAILLRGQYVKNPKEKKLNYRFGYDINIEKGKGKRFLGTEQEMGDYAAFVNINYSPFKNLNLQPGLRYSYNTNYDAPLVYSVNIKWAVKENTSLRASYAKGFRAPSLKELYIDFVDVNHNILGNSGLDAEYSNNINFSVSHNIKKKNNNFGIESAFFHNIIDNIITLANTDNTLYTYVNIDKFKTLGGQVSLKYNYHPRFTFKTGISETGRFNTFSDESSSLSDYSYSTDYNAFLKYNMLKYNISFSIFYKYTGKLPQYYVNDNDEIVEGYISDYNTLDISISSNLWKKKILLSLGGKNLFNNKNINSFGESGGVHTSGSSIPVGWGRTFFIQLNFNFNQY